MNAHEFLKAGSEEETLHILVRAALLAPSSHNTQPWRFLVGPNTIELWGDATRMLPGSDADHRQFFISLGCALENLIAAAEGLGLEYALSLFPHSEEALCVARLAFKDLRAARSGTSPASTAILARQTNRFPYETRKVPQEFLASIRALAHSGLEVHVVEDPAVKNDLVRIFGDATEAAFHDKRFTSELSRWIRPSLKRYRDGMPGYNIGIPWPVSFIVPLAIRYGNVAKQQRAMVEKPARATPVFIVIATKQDDPQAWVEVGRLLERIWLRAIAEGMVMGPNAAPIQIGEFYKELQHALQTELRPQIFARLGYSSKRVPKSPRLLLEEVLLRG